MNSVKHLEREKGALFIETQTLNFIINELKYKIKTRKKEIFEGQKVFLVREYFIPILYGEKFISEVIFDYVALIQHVIEIQHSPDFLKNPLSRHFLKSGAARKNN